MHPILDKIHSTGYWRINIYPSVFNQSLISSLTEVREIIDSCVVSLRGWDYPDIERNNITNGQDWIECTSEFKELGHLEYWRFFQSGLERRNAVPIWNFSLNDVNNYWSRKYR